MLYDHTVEGSSFPSYQRWWLLCQLVIFYRSIIHISRLVLYDLTVEVLFIEIEVRNTRRTDKLCIWDWNNVLEA